MTVDQRRLSQPGSEKGTAAENGDFGRYELFLHFSLNFPFTASLPSAESKTLNDFAGGDRILTSDADMRSTRLHLSSV